MAVYQTAKMRHRITFQSRSTSQDVLGGQLTTWADVATVWAEVLPLSGRELMAAQAVESAISHQVTIRYQTQFANPKTMAAMRIKFISDGVTRLFNIHSARDDEERRKYIIIDAEEGLSDG